MKMARKFRVNQKFFDQESEKMYYFVGAFCGSYLPVGGDRMVFRSRYKKLVEMVRDEIAPNHAITSDKRWTTSKREKRKSSYWIEINGIPILHSKLEELELNVPKSERPFPKNIKEKYLHHLIRGFFDSKANISLINNKYTNIRIDLNFSFLTKLQEILASEKFSGAKGKLRQDGPNKALLCYSHNDSIKIHDFIYQDFRLIRREGIYILSKKQLFNTKYVADGSTHSSQMNIARAKTKVEKAKGLLAKGMAVKDVAEKIGYAHPPSLNRSFKQITGQTPFRYKRHNFL